MGGRSDSELFWIPAHLLPELLRIPSQGYEFELDMPLLSRNKRLTIVEQPIRTIYLDAAAVC
jgi:hypothetical protein